MWSLSVADFASVIEKFGRNSLKAIEEVKRGAIIDLATSIVMQTPVDKGYLANNWFLTLDKETFKRSDKPDPSKMEVLDRIRRSAKAINYKHVVYFANNLPYSVPIEYESHSMKAPSGMVRVNTARWDSIVEANIRRVTK